ncbi:MAG: hypothetical protein M0R46_02455 [Candidatus Muirbacterium halophilum]|nr:hypothetical protein [Candidatus Muirbacterium halophilum]MCK9474752.1 hypothetical protein [Candidatus Muirbacterium halophilum]
MKTEILIQARADSKRLPNKIMLKLAGKSLIEHVYQRCMSTGYKTVILTSDNKSDDKFCEFLKKNQIPFFRGPLQNVLERYLIYANKNSLHSLIRVTGDNPLIDFRKIILFKKLSDKVEYSAITGGAIGTGCEYVRVSSLKKQLDYNMNEDYKEHVTLCIRKNPHDFIIKNIPGDDRFTGLRFTVDEKDDYNTLNKVYNLLYKGIPIENDELFEALKKQPELFAGNKNVKQNKI